MTTSNVRPASAATSPFRSPTSCSTRPLKKSGRVLLRLKSVTRCPRAVAYSTCSGPVKPVPPRMRMSSGFAARPAGFASDRGREAAFSPNASVGTPARPMAPPAAETDLMKVRRVGVIRIFPCSEVGGSVLEPDDRVEDADLARRQRSGRRAAGEPHVRRYRAGELRSRRIEFHILDVLGVVHVERGLADHPVAVQQHAGG